MDTLNDKVVVITGGASGIGLALATAVTRRGAHVVIADVEQAALDAARDNGELPADTLMVRTDVSDPASVSDLRDAVLDRHGRVDVLCNNAGVSTFNMLADQTLDDWSWVLGVNLWGVIHGIAAFLPVFRSQGTASPHRQHILGRRTRQRRCLSGALRGQQGGRRGDLGDTAAGVGIHR